MNIDLPKQLMKAIASLSDGNKDVLIASLEKLKKATQESLKESDDDHKAKSWECLEEWVNSSKDGNCRISNIIAVSISGIIKATGCRAEQTLRKAKRDGAGHIDTCDVLGIMADVCRKSADAMEKNIEYLNKE